MTEIELHAAGLTAVLAALGRWRLRATLADGVEFRARDSGTEAIVRLSNEDARKLGRWLLENVPSRRAKERG